MLLCNTHDLRDFRLGNLEIVHAADAFPPGVYLEHYLRSPRPFHAEDRLENIDDKLHWRVIVVEQNHPIQRRLLDLRPRFLDSEIEVCMVLGLVASLAHGCRMWFRKSLNQPVCGHYIWAQFADLGPDSQYFHPRPGAVPGTA